MTFTDREAKVLKDAMAILNKYLDQPTEKKLQSIADFRNEGVYEFREKSQMGQAHIQGYCESQGMETKIEMHHYDPLVSGPVLLVKYTMNSELEALKEIDRDIL